MPDAITDGISGFLNGSTLGMPNIVFIAMLGGVVIIAYMLLTSKPKVKEFHPLDMKKETKRRFKREYKYFGKPVGKPIYEPETDKPLAFVIGYMKVVEQKELKRLEPVYSRLSGEQLKSRHEIGAKEVYNLEYDKLNDLQKANIDEMAKEEARNEKVEVMDQNAKTKIVRGRKLIEYAEPIPMYMFKICSVGMLQQIMAQYLNVGIDWMLLNKDQVNFEPNKLVLTASFQRRTPFDIFVMSKAGTNLIQDITFGVERENIWQETANQIPRAVHFDTEASKALIYRREDAKIDRDKHKSQSESHDM